MSEVRLPRRRRSVARAPVVVDPAEIPEDAAGRVEVLAVRAPADVVDPADALPPPPPPAPRFSVLPLLMSRGYWPAVGALAAILVAVFVVGMVLTR